MKQREIQFKVWDKKQKKMLTTGFTLYGNGTWFHLWKYDPEVNQSYPNEEFKDPEKSERFEFMQYTGLKDKTGKEIWERGIY